MDEITITQAKLKQAETLLVKLRQANLTGSVYQDNLKIKLGQAETILRSFKEQGLNRFDIFRQAGFYADENRFSDAIAALLDPKRGHQLGILPLKMLLEIIDAKVPESNASRIISVLEQNPSHISVFREKREEKTRPDIEIIGPDFIIFIENKIRGGHETKVNGEWQTKRQWRVLKEKYDRRGALILAIFLTPEGSLSVEKSFVPLSVGELVAALRKAVNAAEQCPTGYAIQAFLDFYGWE